MKKNNDCSIVILLNCYLLTHKTIEQWNNLTILKVCYNNIMARGKENNVMQKRDLTTGFLRWLKKFNAKYKDALTKLAKS